MMVAITESCSTSPAPPPPAMWTGGGGAGARVSRAEPRQAAPSAMPAAGETKKIKPPGHRQVADKMGQRRGGFTGYFATEELPHRELPERRVKEREICDRPVATADGLAQILPTEPAVRPFFLRLALWEPNLLLRALYM